MMSQREYRLALLRMGHTPIPLQGKKPLLNNWQNLVVTEEMINQWGEMGDGTGVLTKTTSTLDIDCRDARAVAIAKDLATKSFEGAILVRTG
jgi:hypothetical protein